MTALLNSFGLGLIVVTMGGWAMYAASVPWLLIGAVVNLVIAAVAYWAVRDSALLH